MRNRFYCHYQAEMFAIFKSLKCINDNQNLDNKTILICTDSQSAIDKINNQFNSEILTFFINNVLLDIRNKNGTIKISKIKVHSGIIENNYADRLAKQASKLSMNCQTNNTLLEYKYLPFSSINKSVTDQCTKAFHASAFDPNFLDNRAKINEWTINFITNQNYLNKNLIEIVDFYTTQILTRHGGPL